MEEAILTDKNDYLSKYPIINPRLRSDRKKTPRSEILKRDGNQCVKCGRMDSLQVHHIMPVCNGGTNEPENLITLCNGCHSEWHSVEKVSLLSMSIWIKYPPVHRLIVMMEKLPTFGSKEIPIADLIHLTSLLRPKSFGFEVEEVAA